MIDSAKVLSGDTKDQIAFALLLLKDWKNTRVTDPKERMENDIYVFKLADLIGVRDQLRKMMPVMPPMDIKPRGGL